MSDSATRHLLTAPGDPDASVVALFTGTFGYRHAPIVDLAQGPEQLRDGLRAFASAADRRHDDQVVLYLAARGRLTADGDATVSPLAGTDDGPGPAVKVRQLVEWLLAETSLRTATVILNLSCPDDQAVGIRADVPGGSRRTGPTPAPAWSSPSRPGPNRPVSRARSHGRRGTGQPAAGRSPNSAWKRWSGWSTRRSRA
ncbi:hypothetical protein ACFQX7_06975 [Luedemannella flava]